MYAVANSKSNSKCSPGAGEPGEGVWGSPHGESMNSGLVIHGVIDWDLDSDLRKWEVDT